MHINHLIVTPENEEEVTFLKSLGVPQVELGNNYKISESDFAHVLDRGFPINGFTREVYTG